MSRDAWDPEVDDASVPLVGEFKYPVDRPDGPVVCSSRRVSVAGEPGMTKQIMRAAPDDAPSPADMEKQINKRQREGYDVDPWYCSECWIVKYVSPPPHDELLVILRTIASMRKSRVALRKRERAELYKNFLADREELNERLAVPKKSVKKGDSTDDSDTADSPQKAKKSWWQRKKKG